MIEIPSDKSYGEFRGEDGALAKFLSDPKNRSLTHAFEKAAKAKFGFAYGQIQIFADKREDLPAIKLALQEMADELKTIPEDRFMKIVSKMGNKP